MGKVALVCPAKKSIPKPPLNLAYIASYLEKNNTDVVIIDRIAGQDFFCYHGLFCSGVCPFVLSSFHPSPGFHLFSGIAYSTSVSCDYLIPSKSITGSLYYVWQCCVTFFDQCISGLKTEGIPCCLWCR